MYSATNRISRHKRSVLIFTGTMLFAGVAAGQTSAVATGQRLPGEGRSFFVQARANF